MSDKTPSYSNPFTEEYPNTCTSCGFLGIINLDKVETEPQEVDAIQRARGSISDRQYLWCFRRMAGLNKEVEASRDGHKEAHTEPETIETDDEAPSRFPFVREVLQKDRSRCEARGAWYEWVEHFGPKWHYEDWRMAELEKLRLAQTELIADAERHAEDASRKITQSQLAVTKKLEAIGSDQAAILGRMETSNDRQDASTKTYNKFFLIIAIVAILLAVVPVAYPNGVGWLTDLAPGAVDPRPQPAITLVLPTPAAAEQALTPTPSPESTPDSPTPQPQQTP